MLLSRIDEINEGAMAFPYHRYAAVLTLRPGGVAGLVCGGYERPAVACHQPGSCGVPGIPFTPPRRWHTLQHTLAVPTFSPL